MRRWARLLMLAAIGYDVAAMISHLDRPWIAAFNALCAVVVGVIWWRTERRIRRMWEHHRQAMLLIESRYAPRPEGVRIIRADGTELSCELIYRGVIDDQFTWEVAGVLMLPGDQLRVDLMPGQTAIEVAHP